MRRFIVVGFLALAGTTAFADDRCPKGTWSISDSERGAKRFDRGEAAVRRAKAISEGHSVRPDEYIVIGARNPELLMRWELMNHLPRAFHPDPAVRQPVRERWLARGAARILGEDFWDDLYSVADEFIESELEMTRTTILLRTASEADRASLERRQSRANSVNCPARADALAAARQLFGEVAFDAFLYRVVAPDAVVRGELGSSPEELLEMYMWLEEGCRSKPVAPLSSGARASTAQRRFLSTTAMMITTKAARRRR